VGSNAKFKIGFCQTHVSKDKAESLKNAKEAVDKVVGMGAELVVLGEMFSCPYATKFFREYGEKLVEPLTTEAAQSGKLLSDLAKQHKVWLVGGSIPELDGDKIYNTCLVFDPEGAIVGRHRKAHLFDIDVPATASRPAMKFKESDVLSPGEQLTLVDLPWCRMGVGICYDVRFPEYALALRGSGAKLLVYPGAFNTTTGPAHWSVLVRGRAVDTQAYVAMISPARSENKEDYQAYGHSMVVNPWAEVMVEAEEKPGVWVTEVDPAEADRIRMQVPTSFQKKSNLYSPYARN
jgi:omega-amidase